MVTLGARGEAFGPDGWGEQGGLRRLVHHNLCGWVHHRLRLLPAGEMRPGRAEEDATDREGANTETLVPAPFETARCSTGPMSVSESPGFDYSSLSTISSLKEWKVSCPEASLAERITSTSFSAQSFGTFQVNFPSGVSFIPVGPDSSFNFKPPLFDFTTGA